MAKIMIQGTASSVGKSILVTALCRIFKQDGYSVCPYKSQNMSLNSYITLDGKEMGRAQVLQAYAAGLEPEVYMNPILLKPTTDKNCQIIFNGEVYGYSNAKEYHNLKVKFKDDLKSAFEKLENQFDIIVMEGAGSPAEINLRDNDIVNMGMAELIDAPVLLVGDIDKGGVFASLLGTIMLLSDSEKDRVKGTIINKFRGDISLLKPGVDSLEELTHRDCLGVVPYFKLDLEDEDGAVDLNKNITDKIDIAIIRLPHISNFTDFDALSIEPDVSVRYVEAVTEFKTPDLVIIPGTKNTLGDLEYLKKSGLYNKIREYEVNGKIIGICGGYQMLGKVLEDPYGVETTLESMEGLDILPIKTVFEEKKITTRVNGIIAKDLINNDTPLSIYGYEIHMGKTTLLDEGKSLININKSNNEEANHLDGVVNNKGNVMGTYIHGVFDGVEFRQHIINELRRDKGIEEKVSMAYEHLREKELDKLADLVRASIDMNKIYKIMGLNR
ncbi:cobalamin biosynthesis protein CobQ [Clostridium sulfidigenes]|uniref:Cobyric acid synthase n=1 Tax=Clostridium sulfidigenes TaxID=318464 RepID=A0A084JCQ5_9CLOT|nr:cobyric acid synthase [Clostridium sulfidigenes]KEZ86739.1 cobalamin biosynthesis protein CobQ [Clostridium sulfidigenes]